MERLLAHPASLPLVHVDHSHRAPAVRTTGECIRVINSNPIHAMGYVYRNGVRVQTIAYALDELDCDTKDVKVSMTQAKAVFETLTMVAGWYAPRPQRISMDSATDEPMPNRKGYFPHELPLATIDAGKIVWLDVMGEPMDSQQAASDHCIERLAAFLTKEYANKFGPRFEMQDVFVI
jgi:hypothetical protein